MSIFDGLWILCSLLLLFILFLLFSGWGLRFSGWGLLGTWDEFCDFNIHVTILQAAQELCDHLLEFNLSISILQDAVFVQLQFSTSVVSEEFSGVEVTLVDYLAELISFALLRRILVHEEEDDRLPDVLEALLVFFHELFE